MAFVQSLGAITAIREPGWYPANSYGRIQMYNRYSADYATIYETQPNVRVCVEFLARNIAQLGLHVYERVSDTDRVRLTDHGLPKLLGRPLPPEFKVTRFRLIESMISDLGIYFNAFLYKVQAGEARGLLRIPPELVEVEGGLVPTAYRITIGGRPRVVSPGEVVHIRGYSPKSPVFGMSPLETLRRILAEEHAAGADREGFWNNSARIQGVIERPADAPEWSDSARRRFRRDWQKVHGSPDGSGKTAILEDGMVWKAAQWSPQQAEYLNTRKLTREECARAYHIPPPFVGILEHATFSNIREQHKNLYQDVLGPWCVMVEEDVDLQLLPDFEDAGDVYTEFNIREKLKGSFEEQTQAVSSAVGRPWMTANEGRALFNMPSLGGDAAELVIPLNVLTGGQASPRDATPDTIEESPTAEQRSKASRGEIDPTLESTRQRHREKWAQVIGRAFERQRDAVLGRLGGKADVIDVWDKERWDRELMADLYKLNAATATVFAEYVAGEIGDEVDLEILLPWLMEHARIQSEEINAATLEQVGSAMLDADQLESVKRIFNLALSVRAWELAVSGVTTAANFGAFDTARRGGLKRKTWRVRSKNPRQAHADLDGVSVHIGERFPNGMQWPGDPIGGADNNAGCQCTVTFGR